MAPLRITFNLLRPMVQPENPIHLDALIAYAVVQEHLLQGTFKSFADSQAALPLAREVRGDLWCWKASALIPSVRIATDQRFLSRKFSSELYSELYAEGLISFKGKNNPPSAGPIDTARNHNKAANFLYPVDLVPFLVGFCVGDQEEITRLLNNHVHEIGKRRRLSHGEVGGITVDHDPMALNLWNQRSLPWPEAGYIATAGSVHPPYWDQTTRVVAYQPLHYRVLP